jgi:diacylglycerol kinase family enzyme
VDDFSIPVNAFFISVSNSNQFGNYVTIAPRASLNDGLIDIVVVKKMNRLFLPFALFHQIAGINKLADLSKLSSKKAVYYFQAGKLKIVNNDLAPLHIDGEPRPAAELIEIEIMPNAFRLLQPSH